MRKFRLLRFILEIKIALHNPYNKRDMALGLWVNGMYGLLNEHSAISFAVTLGSFYVIIRANKKIRRMKK